MVEYITTQTMRNPVKWPAERAQHARPRRVPRVAGAGHLAAEHRGLEQRPPLLLVGPAHQLDARQLALADEVGQLALVVAPHPASLPPAGPGTRAAGSAAARRRQRRHDLGRHGDGRPARSASARCGERARARAPGERRELGGQLVRAREAQRRVLPQAAGDQRLERGRHVRAQLAQRRRLALDHRRQHLGRSVAAEQRGAGRHLAEDRARARTGRSGSRPGRPLACSGDMYSSVPSSMPACVPWRVSVSRASSVAERRRRELREAEVEHLEQPVGRHHQVLGLEVAVDDAGAVRLREAVGELRPEIEQLRDRQRAARQPAAQRLALHVLHHHEVRAGLARRRRRRRRCARCSGG